MKTCQGTGYFQQVQLRLLLCFISSVVFTSSAFALSGNLINSCHDCHGSPIASASGGLRPVDGAWRNITTGSVIGNHQTHVVNSLSSSPIACTPCHGPAPAAMEHRDGRIDMRMHINSSNVNVRGFYNKPAGSPAPFFNQTSVPQLSTCNSVNCHFRKTTGLWGSSLTPGQSETSCAYCHNSSGATPMTTGNHTKHIVKLGNTITTCATCHPNRATFDHATSASHSTITVTFAGAPSLSTGGTYTGSTHAAYPAYYGTTGYGTCNTVYCHSTVQAAGGIGAPTYKAVAWNAAALACNGCHGYNTTADLTTGSHTAHVNTATYNYACSDCHGVDGSGTTANHVNQLVNVDVTNKGPSATYSGDTTPQSGAFGSCRTSVCHGQNSPSWNVVGNTAACLKCHGVKAGTFATISSANVAPGGSGVDTSGVNTTGARVGTHQAHLLASKGMSRKVHCSDCHTNVANNATAITTHLNMTTASMTFSSIANGTAAGKPRATSVARAAGQITCTTTYCHVGYTNIGGTTPNPQFNTTFLNASMALNDCTRCHGMPPLGSGTTGHVSALTALTTSQLSACTGCHNNINAAGTSYTTIFANAQKHIDGNLDASGHAFPYPGSVHMSATGATTPSTTCSCHNSVSFGPYPTTVGAAPACLGCHTQLLRTVATSSCYDCHGASATDGRPNGNAFPNYSGAHTTHAFTKGYTCQQCHSNGGTGSPNHGSSNRINSTNVTFVHVSSTPTYPFHWTGNTVTGNCTTAYCHSSGQSANGTSATPVYAAAVTWNGNAACGSCHAISTFATGSHTKHLAGLATNFSRNAMCADCHTGSTEAAYNSALHVNKLIDVGNGSYSLGGAPGNGYGTCTTSMCHSNGAAAPTYKSATWGTPNAAGCNFCHDAVPTTLSHTIHIGGGANYSFGCAECHGHNGTGTAHNDGTINVIGTIGYNGSKQCTTSDCHSNGKAVGLVYATTPAWGGTITGDRCAACHGNWPTGDAHLAHIVGLHYDDIYNMTGGKIAASATVASATNAGHGNSLYSTTISCNICHYTVVTVNYNDNSPSCNTVGTCHASGGSGGLKGSLTTTSVSKTLHVNRTREVSFAPVTIRSKAQLFTNMTGATNYNTYWTRTNGYKTGASSHDASIATLSVRAGYASGTCSTVVCHSGVTVSWTAGAITCNTCHSTP